MLSLARGGACSTRVVDEQLPRIHGDFRIGTIAMGTNDVLGAGDHRRFAINLRRAVDELLMCCETVVVVTLPSCTGATGADRAARGERVASVNASILVEACDNVVIIDISDLGGPTMLRGDHVHPTALGQLEIADRAATALTPRVPLPAPSSLVAKGRMERGHFLNYPLERLRTIRRDRVASTHLDPGTDRGNRS
jgi:hypothetical protein